MARQGEGRKTGKTPEPNLKEKENSSCLSANWGQEESPTSSAPFEPGKKSLGLDKNRARQVIAGNKKKKKGVVQPQRQKKMSGSFEKRSCTSKVGTKAGLKTFIEGRDDQPSLKW